MHGTVIPAIRLKEVIMKKRVLGIIISSLCVAALLAGCGSSSSSASAKADYAAAEEGEYYDYDYAEPEMATDDVYEYSRDTNSAGEADVPTDSQIQSNSNRKLIKTVNMSAETREFDNLIANVMSRIDSLGGYAESTDISGNTYNSKSARSAHIVARIPAEKLDGFVKSIAEESNITNKNESAEDVTLQYADVEAHKDSLKIEQERLNQLLEQADDLETIIALEDRLTQVRYEIESYESRLRTMNNQVVFATVNLSVQEVKEYTPEPIEEKTFGQRLAEEFLDSCEEAWETIQDFVIGFVSMLPMLLVLLIILGVVFLIVFVIIRIIIAIVKSVNKKKAAKGQLPKNKQPVAKAVNTPQAVVNAEAGKDEPKTEGGENK